MPLEPASPPTVRIRDQLQPFHSNIRASAACHDPAKLHLRQPRNLRKPLIVNVSARSPPRIVALSLEPVIRKNLIRQHRNPAPKRESEPIHLSPLQERSSRIIRIHDHNAPAPWRDGALQFAKSTCQTPSYRSGYWRIFTDSSRRQILEQMHRTAGASGSHLRDSRAA